MSTAAPAVRLALALKTRVSEAELLVGLGLMALALRFPHHQTIPGFSDETEDIYRAALTARGQLFPLTDTSTYIGSLWDWLMAAAFRLRDFSLYAPRALVLAFGVLTVVACYPLGRDWSRGWRLGGLLSALLLATSAEHIAVLIAGGGAA